MIDSQRDELLSALNINYYKYYKYEAYKNQVKEQKNTPRFQSTAQNITNPNNLQIVIAGVRAPVVEYRHAQINLDECGKSETGSTATSEGN